MDSKDLPLLKLKDQMFYLLIALLVVLVAIYFILSKTADVLMIALISILYLVSILILNSIVSQGLSKLKLIETSSNLRIFIKAYEKKLILLSVILAIIIFAVNVYLLYNAGSALDQNAILNILPVVVAFIIIAYPKNLSLFLDLFLFSLVQSFLSKNIKLNKPTAIEDLSSVKVMVIDDTIALNDKKLILRKIFSNWEEFDINELYDEHKIFIYLCLSSQNNMSEKYPSLESVDSAINDLCSKLKIDLKKLQETYSKFDEPKKTNNGLMYFHNIGKRKVAIMLGSPEEIVDKCNFIDEEDKIKPLAFINKKELIKQITKFSSEEMQVFALAYKVLKNDNDKLDEFVFLGFLGFTNSYVQDFVDFVNTCKNNMLFLYLTKDSKTTAMSKASQVGIITNNSEVVDWEEFKDFPKSDLIEKLKTVHIITGSNDKEKQELFYLLNDLKLRFAFFNTTDSLDFKPVFLNLTLSSSNEERQKIADVVLEDKNLASFSLILNNSKLTINNLANYIRYNTIVALSVFLILVSPLFLLSSPSISVTQMIFLSLIVFNLPSFSLAFEITKNPLKGKIKRDQFLYKSTLVSSLLLSIVIAVITIFIFITSLEKSPEYAVTAGFISFCLSNSLNLLNMRSIRYTFIRSLDSGKLTWVALLMILLILSAIFYIPEFQSVFGIKTILQDDLILVVMLSFFVIIFEEFRKLIIRL